MKKSSPQATVAGILMILAGVITFLSITVAEAFYPGHNSALNVLSDLGSTGNGTLYQPSSYIFNLSMAFVGTLIMAASYILSRYNFKKWFVIVLALYGVGTMGVGLFIRPFILHSVFAGIAFVAGGFSAVLSYKIIKSPLRYLALSLGLLALGSLLLFELLRRPLGVGGAERLAVYPITLWLIAYGGHLTNSTPKPD